MESFHNAYEFAAAAGSCVRRPSRAGEYTVGQPAVNLES